MTSNAGNGQEDKDAEEDRGRPPSQKADKVEKVDEIEAVEADLGALVQAHPVGTLVAAVGLGYALGGGIFTRLTSRVFGLSLRLGMQFAVLPALEREIATLAGLDKGGDGTRRPEKGRTRH